MATKPKQEILEPLSDEADELPELKEKYRILADAVLAGKTITEAGRIAGYVGGNIGISASRTLKRPDVSRYLAIKRSMMTEQAEYSSAIWTKELRGLAHSNVQDFTRLDANGELQVDFSNATREQLAAVSGVKVKKRKIYDSRGNMVGEEHQSEFRLWDKLRAAELLGRHAGFLKEPEQKVIVDVADRLLQARQRVMRTLPSPAGGSADGEAE